MACGANHSSRIAVAVLLAVVLGCCAAAAAAAASSQPPPPTGTHHQQHQGRTSSTSSSSGTSPYTRAAEADRVLGLPGAPEGSQDFGLFAGYVTVDEAAGRALFYVFAESRHDPANAPLVLWLNGGPGCSSLGGGFMSELGPWYPTKDGRNLQVNPWAWNNMANVLWLESPAFVGFSYSNSSADAIVGDARTAADARLFLLHWLRRFPQFKDSDLYLTGESYAGHYLPNLAAAIVDGNARAQQQQQQQQQQQAAADIKEKQQAGSSSAEGDDADNAAAAAGAGALPGRGRLNLRGFFVGNAWTDPALDNRGALDYWYSHALISAEAYKAVSENCDFTSIGPLMRGSQALALPHTHTRQAAAAAPELAAAARAALLHEEASSVSNSVSDEGALQRAAAQRVAAAAASLAPQPPAATARDSSGSSSSSGSTSGLWRSLLARAGWSSSSSSNSDAEMVCARWLDIAQSAISDINIYDIFVDVCVPPKDGEGRTTGGSSSSSYSGALLGDVQAGRQRRRRQGGGADAGGEVGRHPRRPRYDPCIDGEVAIYLNLPEVQAALHANQTVKLPWAWSDCTSQISYSREDLLTSMLPVYRKLLAAEPALKIWVFSGDVDGIVPVLGSRRWVEGLELPVTRAWRAWTSSTGQVGGWRVDYRGGLTFATVRNGGHMVPYTQPERGYALLAHFLFGDAPPSATTSDGSSSSGGPAAA